MAKKYIDAERFVEHFGDWYTEEGTELGFVGPIKDLVFRMPAADVVEVVRCKDCKYAHMTMDGYCKYCDIWFSDEKEYMPCDYYCASGERKDG